MKTLVQSKFFILHGCFSLCSRFSYMHRYECLYLLFQTVCFCACPLLLMSLGRRGFSPSPLSKPLLCHYPLSLLSSCSLAQLFPRFLITDLLSSCLEPSPLHKRCTRLCYFSIICTSSCSLCLSPPAFIPFFPSDRCLSSLQTFFLLRSLI